MMVVQKGMDVNKEAQDYLAQFSIPSTKPPESVNGNLESMLDTWTREKYRSKGFNKKSSNRHSLFSKEWEKVAPNALGAVFDHVPPNMEYMADDILYPGNSELEEEILDDQQETYMNEEAFLEQLLFQDTDQRKPKSRKLQSQSSASKQSTSKTLPKKQTQAKKSFFEEYNHQKALSNDENFVAGHHVSNESRRAVLRRGVCKEEIGGSPRSRGKEQIAGSPRNRSSRSIKKLPQSPTDQTQSIPVAYHNFKNQTMVNGDNLIQQYTPAVTPLHPICQKCGWTLTATLEKITLPNMLNITPSGGNRKNSADNSFHNNSQQSGDNSESSTGQQSVTSTGQQSVTSTGQQSVTNKSHGSPRTRTISSTSSSMPVHQHLNSNSSNQSLPHNDNLLINNKLSPQHVSVHNHNPNHHQQRSHLTLTTSKHCYSRASQTDPNLLSQDLSPFAEVTSVSSDGNNVNNRNSNNRINNRGSFTKAKPPSGRQIKEVVPCGGGGGMVEQVPVVEAAKDGNVELLKHLLTSDVEQSKVHDVQGNNLLHIAAERGHLVCVQYLADTFACLCEQENKAKFTPAALTIKAGHVEVLEWLLDNSQAKEEILPVSNKKSLLHHAAKFGQDGCLRTVLEKMNPLDRNRSCCDNNGNSPAHVAAKHGHLLCLQSLVEYGVDATKANKYGHSPCYYADFSNHRLCAGYLMVVETCLNLAKKLIRLERSMEQLSNSLAKYSDNQSGDAIPLTYDYNADKSSGTSSVEDDGTRDEAWQLLCRKFEEASKRLVVFRTQNRAIRPVRPSKLALLALAQTKEETQAALSVINKVKTAYSSTVNLIDNDSVGDERNLKSLHQSRSKSAPDLPSSVSKETFAISVPSNDIHRLNQNTDNKRDSIASSNESAFVITGIPSCDRTTLNKPNILEENKNVVTSFKDFEDDLNNIIKYEKENTFHVTALIHKNDLNTHSNSVKKKVHRRSSSVGDIIENEITVHKATEELEYHLKTRVMSASPKVQHKIPDTAPPLPDKDPPPLPPRQVPPVKPRRQAFSPRGVDVMPPPPPIPPPPIPPPPHIGENEQTSDFFEEITNGRYDSSDNVSELDVDTLQKILDMQEEIMRCDPNFTGLPDFSNTSSRIRTPVKLELTHEDFNETYARKLPFDNNDEASSVNNIDNDQQNLSYQYFRRRGPPPIRIKAYGDTMNKSGNNSHIITDTLENIMENEDLQQEQFGDVTSDATLDDGDLLLEQNNNNEDKPWYEMTDEEATVDSNHEPEEFFTLL